MKRYLITGSSGYIGQNITFIEDISFGFCDYDTELPPAHKLTKDIVKNYDGVIHLAALSGIFACEESPWKAVEDNVLSAGNVFDICSSLGIPVVFTSSQAAKDPQSSFYANMKWICETLADGINRDGGKIYVVRLSNVYGGVDYLTKKNTCVKQFITQYTLEQPFQIHGDGQQIRDFIHVYDICKAIYKIITIQPDYFEPIDIGTGKGNSILDMRNMFPSHPCEFVNTRSAGAESSIADTSTLEKLTGFKPERRLEDYIKEMI